MAKANEAEKTNFIQKVGPFFKNLGIRIVRAFRDMWAELKKVTWPTRGELVNYSLVVLGFLVAMGVIIFVIDTGAAALVKWIT